MAVGIAAIAWSILCGIVYPIYKQLWLNYQLHLNFQYFVSKPTIMSPVEYVDEKLQEVYEEKKKLPKLDAQAKEAAKAKEKEAEEALKTAQHKLAEAQETQVQAATTAATRAWDTWHKAVIVTLDWDDDDLTFEHIFVIATVLSENSLCVPLLASLPVFAFHSSISASNSIKRHLLNICSSLRRLLASAIQQ
jgi:hypothetical protein